MKSLKVLLAALLVITVSFGVIGCSGDDEDNADTTRIGQVTRGSMVIDISAAGNLELAQTEDLAVDMFYQQGTVAEVHVEVGDSVTAGQVLVEIDADEWQEHIDTLEEAVTTAQRLVETRERALATAERLVTTREHALQTAQRLVTTRDIQRRQAQVDVEAAEYNLSQMPDILELQTRIDYLTAQLEYVEILILFGTGQALVLGPQEKARIEGQIAEATSELNDILTDNSLSISTTAAHEVTRRQLAVEAAQASLSDAEAVIVDAELAVVEADASLASAVVDADYASTDLAAAVDDHNEAQVSLDEALASNPVITAPFDGFITQVNVAGGDEVVRGTVAVQMADPGKFEANILVSEMDILQVSLGSTATIVADAVTGAVYPATVTYISPTATIQSGVVNYQVTVELQQGSGPVFGEMPDPDEFQTMWEEGIKKMEEALEKGELTPEFQDTVDMGFMSEDEARDLMEMMVSGDFEMPEMPAGGFGDGFGGSEGAFGGGMGEGFGGRPESQLPSGLESSTELRQGLTVTVSIIVAQEEDVLLVPNSAVITEGIETYVEVVTADGETEKRPVTTGLSDWQNTIITEGLEEGEDIVIPLNISS